MSGILAAGAIASVVSNRRRDSAAAAAVSGGGSEGMTFKAMAIMEGARESVNGSGAHNASGESLFTQSSVAVALEAGDGGKTAEGAYFSTVEQSAIGPSEDFSGEQAAAKPQGVATIGVLEDHDLAQEGAGGVKHDIETGVEASSEHVAASPADAVPVLESDGEDAMSQVAVPKGSHVEVHAGLDDEVNAEETAPLRGGWEGHDEERGVDGATRESQDTGM